MTVVAFTAWTGEAAGKQGAPVRLLLVGSPRLLEPSEKAAGRAAGRVHKAQIVTVELRGARRRL